MLKACPPRSWTEDPILTAHLERRMQMDIAAQREIKLRMSKLPLLGYAGWASSSGLRMATELRRFWNEYFVRFGQYGPTSFPSSFNVLEAFVRFDKEFLTFLLPAEREHLLSFADYLEWYTASAYPEEPLSLVDVMADGVAYSYDFILGPDGPFLKAEEATLAIAGISLIRHGDELAMLLLAGESPPLPAGTEHEYGPGTAIKGKEGLTPSPDADAESRLLEGATGYSRVLLASRFDLSTKRNDVRYVLCDAGPSFHIATDDHEMLRASLSGRVSPLEYASLREAQAITLRRYIDLYSAAAACIYLPAFFIDQHRRVVKSEFMTQMGLEPKTSKVKRVRRDLGEEYFRSTAAVDCLSAAANVAAHEFAVAPPTLQFNSTGYWKALEPGEIGTTRNGRPIVGKTWVHRTEMWESTAPETFLARSTPVDDSADSGRLYIMRSPSHAADIYKIGITTRDVVSRKNELTGATSTPLPFEILASWSVGNVKAIENEVQRALAPYRLSPRREFFRLPLAELVRIIEPIVSRPKK